MSQSHPESIYLDYSSTTPIDPQVAWAMGDVYQQQLANPASQHRAGQAARRRLESARSEILRLLGGLTTGMASDQLIFTSGGTESNNLALAGSVSPQKPLIVISGIEHPSVTEAARALSLRGYQLEILPTTVDGLCDLSRLEGLLQSGQVSLVSLMLVNNETGVIQPVAEAARLCREYGVTSHCDAVQAVGKIPVNFRDFGIDLMSVAAHKFYGPRGIGALLVRHGFTLAPILYGGVQQRGLRPGTEDVALAVGCQSALNLVLEQQSLSLDRIQKLSKMFVETIRQSSTGSVVVVAENARRVPHILKLSFPGLDRQALLLAADMAGIYFSTGSACASGSSEASPVLLAMGLDRAIIEGAVRISFGYPTTESECGLAASQIGSIVNDLRR